MSIARRHRTRVLAALAATSTATMAARPADGPQATEYELQRARLGVDLRKLKALHSVEAKVELKRQLLPGDAAWVQGVLDAAAVGAQGVDDEILIQIMIWRVDVGDHEGALPLIEYVLRWGLALPSRFTSTPAAFVV